LRKFKKMYGARLELKEAEWMETQMKVTKQSSSIIIRDLIRSRIALDVVLQRPQPTDGNKPFNPLANKPLSSWNIPLKQEASQ
jgi:hypothetical protein